MSEANIDLIYDVVDAMLRDGRFDLVDGMLMEVNLQGDADTLLAYLTVTLPAKSKLDQRAHFFACVEQELKLRGEWRETLLAGLE